MKNSMSADMKADTRIDGAHCAAARIYDLVRDLRRQAEAWADREPAPEIAANNTDVDEFNRRNVERVMDRQRDVLVDVMAEVIRAETGGGTGGATQGEGGGA